MRFLVSFLPLLALVAGQAHGQNQTDCLNHQQRHKQACYHYHYDPVTVYFRDQNTLEQEVTVHRIRNNTGRIMHIDLDFKFQCTTDCSTNTDQAINTGLSEFRAAYLRNDFYRKRWLADCGNDNLCEDSSSAAPPHSSGSGLNLLKGLIQDSPNGQELRKQLAAQQRAPSKFIIHSPESTYNICALTNSPADDCIPIESKLTITDNVGFAELSHNLGHDFNTALANWLNDWFWHRPIALHCSQSLYCDFDDYCTVQVSCLDMP